MSDLFYRLLCMFTGGHRTIETWHLFHRRPGVTCVCTRCGHHWYEYLEYRNRK